MTDKPILQSAEEVEEKYNGWIRHPHETTRDKWQHAEAEFVKHFHRTWKDVLEQHRKMERARG